MLSRVCVTKDCELRNEVMMGMRRERKTGNKKSERD